jgi:hypothetical protein
LTPDLSFNSSSKVSTGYQQLKSQQPNETIEPLATLEPVLTLGSLLV